MWSQTHQAEHERIEEGELSAVSVSIFLPFPHKSRSLSQVPIPRTGASEGFGRTTTAHRLLSPLGWRERGCKEKNSCGAPTFSLGQQTSSFEPLGVSTKESGGPSILKLASPNLNSLLTSPPAAAYIWRQGSPLIGQSTQTHKTSTSTTASDGRRPLLVGCLGAVKWDQAVKSSRLTLWFWGQEAGRSLRKTSPIA